MAGQVINKEQIIQEAEALPVNTPMDFSELEKKAPAFAKIIVSGMAVANESSSLDVDVPKPDKFELVNTAISSWSNLVDGTVSNISLRGMQAMMIPSVLASDHMSVLRVEKGSLKKMQIEDMSNTIAHENGHELRSKNYTQTFLQMNEAALKGDFSRKRIEEFAADRTAEVSGMIGIHLRHITPDFYDKDSANPSPRSRVGALLAEYYGNDIFKDAGTFSDADKRFHPITLKNGIPVTEEGKQVTNWKVIDSDLNNLVNEDLKWLDSHIASRLSVTEIDEFKQRISNNKKQLEQTHQPQLEDALPWYTYSPAMDLSSQQYGKLHELAWSLVKHGSNAPEITQQNIQLEPRMAGVYAALDAAKKDISKDNHYSDEEKVKLEQIALLSIAKHLERGQFPRVNILDSQESQQTAPGH